MKLPKWLEINTDRTLPVKPGPRYWFRTPVGMEHLVANEIREKLPVAHLFESHRNVFTALDPADDNDYRQAAQKIRTADDVYRYLGSCEGIDRTKGSLDRLIAFVKAIVAEDMPVNKNSGYFRSTVSFVGKRNFNRYSVEEKINTVLAERFRLRPLSNERSDSKVPGELRLRCHIEDQTAFWGWGWQDTPLHRRSWRSIRYSGQLHTPVAAGMVRALSPKPDRTIIDPFCGSGTLLIETAIQYPDSTLLGFDIKREAIEVAQQSAVLAGVTLKLEVGDSFEAIQTGNSFHLISNPPWDEKHQISGGNRERFVKGLGDLVTQSASAVLLMPEDLANEVRRKVEKRFKLVAQTRIRGKLAVMVRFED